MDEWKRRVELIRNDQMIAEGWGRTSLHVLSVNIHNKEATGLKRGTRDWSYNRGRVRGNHEGILWTDGRGKRGRILVTLKIPLFSPLDISNRFLLPIRIIGLKVFHESIFMVICERKSKKSIKLSHMLLHSFVRVLRSMCNIHCHAFPTTNLLLTFDQHYMCDYLSIGVHTISFKCPLSYLLLISLYYFSIH